MCRLTARRVFFFLPGNCYPVLLAVPVKHVPAPEHQIMGVDDRDTRLFAGKNRQIFQQVSQVDVLDDNDIRFNETFKSSWRE